MRKGFEEKHNRKELRRRYGLPEDGLIYLVMGGSMGIWKNSDFCAGTGAQIKRNGTDRCESCGNNQKLETVLRRELEENEKVHILGFTEQVAEDSAVPVMLIFTKPGGLSSTEAAISRIPIVHTNPIPGCENCNLEFFQSRGCRWDGRAFSGR